MVLILFVCNSYVKLPKNKKIPNLCGKNAKNGGDGG